MASKHWTRHLEANPHRRPTEKDKTSAIIAAKANDTIKRSGVPTGPVRHQ